jgi:hypothetical protein
MAWASPRSISSMMDLLKKNYPEAAEKKICQFREFIP